uniref:Fungal lipase-type domain-containing protein n=1 Tax=Ananas comosus var. bracteatus TaxID=296719 RepID=A0A6V7P088_ANACO|nr:unnamed protein product [Ananas comosus var. bracteatus]
MGHAWPPKTLPTLTRPNTCPTPTAPLGSSNATVLAWVLAIAVQVATSGAVGWTRTVDREPRARARSGSSSPPIPGPDRPHSAESLPLDSEESPDEGSGSGSGSERGRANWVERVLQVRTRWRGRQHKEEEEEEEDDDDESCGVSYDSSSSSEEERREWDRESFARVLGRVALAEARRFAQLALLCNLAYAIPAIKVEDLKKRYGLHFVTSSLEKKSVAAAIKSELETDSTRPPPPTPTPTRTGPEPSRPFRPSVAYEIAASAASYVRCRARASSPSARPPRAGPTRVVPTRMRRRCRRGGAGEVVVQVGGGGVRGGVDGDGGGGGRGGGEAGGGEGPPLAALVPLRVVRLRRPRHPHSLLHHSGIGLASFVAANLLFEPTTFEDTGVLVHRGIYEAAKGIYDQFVPEIEAHLRVHGDRARLRFSGHSLGGSLALLVSLMLLARGAAERAAVLPVVTFGAPSVFCGGSACWAPSASTTATCRRSSCTATSCPGPSPAATPTRRPCCSSGSTAPSAPTPASTTRECSTLLWERHTSSSPTRSRRRRTPPPRRGRAVRHRGTARSERRRRVAADLQSRRRQRPADVHELAAPSRDPERPEAYGSDGTIRRDHESSNYAKALDALVKQQHVKPAVRWHAREHQWLPQQWWPPLVGMESPGLVAQEVISRS